MLCLASILGMSLTAIPVRAIGENDLKVTSIVANSKVGDGQREVESFEITVNDASLISDIKASDFDIVNNVSSVPFDINTGTFANDYLDDEIELNVKENTIIMEVKPFDYTGKYNSDFTKNPWKVKCSKYPELSFTANEITKLNTKTLDETIRGTFEYAGLKREYALYVPKNATGPVPLVVWNHGGGEYASNIENTLVANRGLTAWPEAGYETAVLVTQISNPNYSYGTANSPERQKLIDQNNALQAKLIQELIDKNIVDARRVYVTGASSGGGATMRFVMQYPDLFAGAIACCSMDPIVNVHWQSGCHDSYETIVNNFETAFSGNVYTWDEGSQQMISKDVDTESLIDLPIYFTHAENDPTCSSNSSKAMYEALCNLGDTNNKITIWSDEEMNADGITNGSGGQLLHWSWVKLFNHNEEGSPMNWLFKQQKVLVNKADLLATIEKVESMNLTGYTEASVTTLTNLLEDAKSLYQNQKASQQEVDQMNTTLLDAINSLEKVDTEETNKSNINDVQTNTNTNKPSSSVKTGDTSDLYGYLGLMIVSSLTLTSVLIHKRIYTE